MTEPDQRDRRLAAMPAALRRDRLRAAIALCLLVIAAAACSSGIGLPGPGPLMTVQMRGGLCPEGPCDQTITLERNGRVHSAVKPPNDLGVVPAQAMATLTAAIQATDFAALRSHPFTDVCPIAFDGQELVFEFAVGTGTQRIASCEVAIDWGHPLFVAVGVALGAWIPIPLT
jgi:hypothetical protein